MKTIEEIRRKRNEYQKRWYNKQTAEKKKSMESARYSKYSDADARKKRAELRKKYLDKNPERRIMARLRTRLSQVSSGYNKSASAVRDLGCSIEFFKEYIASKFQEGMSWDNYGEWHIDHIYPLSKVDFEDSLQIKKAIHYTNLQPLWAIENIIKSDTIL